MDPRELERFIIIARERTAQGQARRSSPERPGAVEIIYREGSLTYRDSYFGGSRLIGQEIVRRAGQAVWGMNYLILIRSSPLPSEELAAFVQRAQLARYRERRLLGPHEVQERSLRYLDQNEGTIRRFWGKVEVFYREQVLLEMLYHGGLVQ